jgi:hypothetical protein
MSKISFAPLINLLYGIAALGEAVGRYATGDIKGSGESGAAALLSFLCGIFFMDDDIRGNLGSTINNIVMGTIAYVSNDYLKTDSFTFKFFPLIAMYQVATNSFEGYLKLQREKEKEIKEYKELYYKKG